MALKRPSYAEIEALPEWLRGENLAGGLVVVSPRPAKPHLRAATRLCARIFRPFEDDEAAFSVRPDWICELLSPSTAVHDRVHKLPFSGRAGVSHAWLIDPVLRTLEVYANRDGQWLLQNAWQGAVIVRADPFGAIELPLAALWLPPRKPV